MQCAKCGAKNTSNRILCVKCGARLRGPAGQGDNRGVLGHGQNRGSPEAMAETMRWMRADLARLVITGVITAAVMIAVGLLL